MHSFLAKSVVPSMNVCLYKIILYELCCMCEHLASIVCPLSFLLISTFSYNSLSDSSFFLYQGWTCIVHTIKPWLWYTLTLIMIQLNNGPHIFPIRVIPQGTIDNNLGPDCLAGTKALDPNYCKQQTLSMHYLCP